MGSDDEDLASLRLAALKTLKKESSTAINPINNYLNVDYSTRPPPPYKQEMSLGNDHRNYRGKLKIIRPRANHGMHRNGGVNPRVNTNLISIPIADHTKAVEVVKTDLRKPVVLANANDKVSKFSRYDHSDHSESESDSEERILESDDESIKRSESCNSLDRLMDELENEIAGNKTVPKPVKSSKSSNEDNKKIRDKSEEATLKKKEVIEVKKEPMSLEIEVESQIIKPQVIIPDSPIEPKITSPVRIKVEPQTDSPEMPVISIRTVPNEINRSPVVERPTTHSPNDQIRPPPFESRPRSPFERYKSPDRGQRRYSRSPTARSYGHKVQRPISPLRINTDVLNTITMAPLSPRSAAFVLQNREILAKRKLSPSRRSISSRSSSSSISRSPSRRRSVSPFSSRLRSQYSPARRVLPRKRSISPLYKNEQQRRRSRSPAENRTHALKRRSISPRMDSRNGSPPRRSLKHKSKTPPPKRTIHRRLGSRKSIKRTGNKDISIRSRNSNTDSKRSISISLSPSPDRKVNLEPLNSTTGTKTETTEKILPSPSKVDPVLEARRRKFENNKPIESVGGIIKLTSIKSLKKKNDVVPIELISSNIPSDSEAVELNPTVADLWSSEESDNENEGRFKVSTDISTGRKIKNALPKTANVRSDDTAAKRQHRPHRDRRQETAKTVSHTRKRHVQDRISYPKVVSQKPEKERIKFSNDTENSASETKSNIKINYRTSHKNKDEAKQLKEVNDNQKTEWPKTDDRKVTEIHQSIEQNQEHEPEIIIEEDDISTNEADDLRAEISRRRAQRKASTAPVTTSQGPPARILQTAFQEMSKKSVSSLSTFPRPPKGNGKSERRVLMLKRGNGEIAERISSVARCALVASPKARKLNRETKLPIRMRLGKTGSENQKRSLPVCSDDDDFLGLHEAVHLDDDTFISEKKNRGGRKKRVIALQV